MPKKLPKQIRGNWPVWRMTGRKEFQRVQMEEKTEQVFFIIFLIQTTTDEGQSKEEHKK